MIKTKAFSIERKDGDTSVDDPVLHMPLRIVQEARDAGFYHAHSVTKRVDDVDDIIVSAYHYESPQSLSEGGSATILFAKGYKVSITAQEKIHDIAKKGLEYLLRRKLKEEQI